MKNLAQFFQEDNGSFSATRLAFLVWVFGALVLWGVDCFQHDRKMQEIPQSVQVLIGVLMTGKVAQKFTEEKPDAENFEDGGIPQQRIAVNVQQPLPSSNGSNVVTASVTQDQ